MANSCSEANCNRPVRGRGLCQGHYASRYKIGDLPPLEKKELLVKHKLYLTKEQTLRARRLAGKERLSAFLRSVIDRFLVEVEKAETAD